MCKQFETCERRLIGKGPVWMACTLAALGLTVCSPARGQARRAAATRRAPLQTMGAPAATQGTIVHRGTVRGVVFWDSRRVAYSPSGSCQGLQINLSAVSGTSVQSLGTTSQLQLKTPTQPASSIYQCGFSFGGVPERITLKVQLTIGQPFSLRVGSAGPFKGATAFEIPGGACGNSSPAPDFESGWQSCGENLNNVNFQLVPRNMAQAAPAPGAVLQQTPRTLLPAQPQNGAVAAAPTHGLLLPAVNGGPVMSTPVAQPAPGGTSGGNARMLNPQPYPPKSAPNASGSANPASANVHAIGNSNAPEATSALIGLLRKQGSLRVVSGRPAKYASSTNVALVNTLRRQKQAGQIGAGHAMASRTSSISSMVEAPNPALHATRVYVASDLLTDQENRWCQRQEADGKAPTILRVDGQTHGIQFSPDPQANPYTIVGCGFGNSNGTAHLYLLQYQYVSSGWSNSQSVQTVSAYTVQFTIQSWSDHEIVASVDPTTSGVPDWSQVILEVKANLAGDWPGGQFTALRQTVALASISQNQVSLDQAGSPYFLSPVSNYYGLNGSVGVARQGLAGPVAGQDQFKLKLAPGFVVDSTETDLLVSNTSSNVTSQPATLNGNTITVTYPVVSAPSGNSVVYYSIYGLKVYVTGPVGMNPLAQ